MLAFFVHFLMTESVRLIDFRSRQPLKVLKKRVAQRGVFAPVFGQQLFRPALYGDDCHGDQRHAEKQDSGAGQTDRREKQKQRQRRKHRVEKLRQIRGEIRLQLVDAFDADLHDLAGAHILLVAASEAQQFLIDQMPQLFLDGRGAQRSHAACHNIADKADEDHGGGDPDEGKRDGNVDAPDG